MCVMQMFQNKEYSDTALSTGNCPWLRYSRPDSKYAFRLFFFADFHNWLKVCAALSVTRKKWNNAKKWIACRHIWPMCTHIRPYSKSLLSLQLTSWNGVHFSNIKCLMETWVLTGKGRSLNILCTTYPHVCASLTMHSYQYIVAWHCKSFVPASYKIASEEDGLGLIRTEFLFLWLNSLFLLTLLCESEKTGLLF